MAGEVEVKGAADGNRKVGVSSKTRDVSFRELKMKSLLKTVQSDSELPGALLIAGGAFFLLLVFKFFAWWLVPFLLVPVGLVAYKNKPLGLIFSGFLAFPGIVYQSPVLGWLYLLILTIMLIEAWTYWYIIAILEILVLAPFAPEPLNFLGGIVIPVISLSALVLGSKRSLFMVIPCVFTILLLSSLWGVQNNAFMPLNLDAYQIEDVKFLFNNFDPPALFDLKDEALKALGSMMSGEHIRNLNVAIGVSFSHMLTLLFGDSGLIQIICWASAVFAIGFIPGVMKHRYEQTIASLSLWILPAGYYLAAIVSNAYFDPLIIVFVLTANASVAVLEHYKIYIAGESKFKASERAKKFGKFGVQDLSTSAGNESLESIGGYDGVKKELNETIVWPLQQKELAVAYGISPPHGVLLFGPPGTGKTLLMRALSKELGMGFYYVKCSELLSQWYGESLSGDQELLISENGLVKKERIDRIVDENKKVKVLSFDGSGRVSFSDIKKYIKHKCTSPILEVKTRSGRKIKVTDYHSLFTLNGTTITSIKSSELIPKSSYILTPSKIHFSDDPINKIDLFATLREKDYGLKVKNARSCIKKAVDILGEKECIEVLGFSNKHRFREHLKLDRCISASGFVKLMEKAGITYNKETVKIYRGSKHLPGILEIDKDFSTFLGLWIAEGSYQRSKAIVLSVSEAEAESVVKLCEKLFGKVHCRKKGKGADIHICSCALFILFRHILGLEHGARNKKMPAIAYNLSKENLAALLRGYFSGDGNIHINQRGVVTVEASTASTHLADDLLYLLLYFGIVASVHDKKEWTGQYSKRISITGYKKLKNFMQINFLDSIKNEKIMGYLNRINSSWHRSDLIPMNPEFKEMVKKHTGGYWQANNMCVGKDILLPIDWGESEPEFLEFLRNDVYLDRVEEIKQVKDEEFVYDVSVDPCQNFVAGFGGIFAHNSERNLTELFQIARRQAPCILFFDEIDSIGKKRESYSSDDVAPRLMSLFLQELDGFKDQKNVIVIGATNIPNKLDHALMRPGRFDKIIYMSLPDRESRNQIFKVHAKKLPLSEDVDFEKLSEISERYSGADLANVCTEAARLAAEEAVAARKVMPVTMAHFRRVLDSIRPSVSLEKLEEYDQFKMDFERRVAEPKKKDDKEDKVTWDDVVGLDDVRKALIEAIELPLLHEDLIKQYKIKPSKGLLLFGPPGCGKTLIVKAAANELKASFLTISGASMLKRGYENAVGIIKETFNRARERAPALIFIDEIESIAPSRDLYSNKVVEDIVTQMLTELDGVKELKNVMLIGATNKPKMIDAALMRPGRLDKIVFIPPPSPESRAAIFKVNLEGIPLEADVNLVELAKNTEGFTGADIASVCQEAKMTLVRRRIHAKEQTEPKLDHKTLVGIASKRRPSITVEHLKEYLAFLKQYGERK